VRAHVFCGKDAWAELRGEDGGVSRRASATQSGGHLRRAEIAAACGPAPALPSRIPGSAWCPAKAPASRAGGRR